MTSTVVKFQSTRSNATRRLHTLEARFPEVAFRVCGDKDSKDFKGFYIAADLTKGGADQANVLAEQGILVELPTKAEKPAKNAKKAKASPADETGAPTPREGTKQALMIDMLRRPKGATAAEIAAKTGWQLHTIRGAIAGALKKKLGLTVLANKVDGRGNVYSIPA